jgi:hypothetical protein
MHISAGPCPSDPRCQPHKSRRPDTAERVTLLSARSPSFVLGARLAVLRSITGLAYERGLLR